MKNKKQTKLTVTSCKGCVFNQYTYCNYPSDTPRYGVFTPTSNDEGVPNDCPLMHSDITFSLDGESE